MVSTTPLFKFTLNEEEYLCRTKIQVNLPKVVNESYTELESDSDSFNIINF